jgi:hypothetical protein
MRQETAMEGAADINIEKEISNVLTKLHNFDETNEVSLSLNVVAVGKKITSENRILLNEVTSNVVRYFPFVQNAFRELDQARKNKFELIASNIKSAYLKMQAENLTQDEIYSKMSEWLQRKTQTKSASACRIIISFFIQNCEVFYATTK